MNTTKQQNRKQLFILESLRNHFDDRVMDVWENGDSDFELGISLESLLEIHKAARLLDFMLQIEAISDSELEQAADIELDSLTDLYRSCAYELEDLYLSWYQHNFEFKPFNW